jgi:methionyl-tRNA formyltransferase
MRLVFFGSGSRYSMAAFHELVAGGDVVGVVVPVVRTRHPIVRAMAWMMGSPLRRRVEAAGLPLIRFDADDPSAIAALDADLFCVASFPFILKEGVLRCAKRGALNAHPSLLPRHRGADPLFWTYFQDDATTGVTVHWIGRGVDDGDVVDVAECELVRGTTRVELELTLGSMAGHLLRRCVTAIDEGRDARTPQDPESGSHEPLPSRTAWQIDFAARSAEQVWHFLRGVGTSSLRVPAGDAIAFTIAPHERAPGTIEESNLYCRDGWVTLAKPSWKRRLWRVLRRRGQ